MRATCPLLRIDGEAIAFEGDGLASFALLRHRRQDRLVTLCAFDLIEIDGKELRWKPLERRKALLAQLLRKPLSGLALNATFEEPGDVVSLGSEGLDAPPALNWVSATTPTKIGEATTKVMSASQISVRLFARRSRS